MQESQQQIDTNPFPEVHWNGRKVLLISKEQDLLDKLNQFFTSEGMLADMASTKEQAWELFEPAGLDLLVIDTDCGEEGLSLGHRFKLAMKQNFVPLLFISANKDDLSMASCFEAGGDDLIEKPYSETLLFARVNSLLKMGGIYRQQFKEREELAYYHAMMEDEQRLAKSIFSSIVHQDYLDQKNIQYTLSPMSIFNGDVLLSASTPNGQEYILLGDFTGHGLTASIGTLPVSEIFYAMTSKGFELSTILAEINRRLCTLLPVGMFMATYAIKINRVDQAISVWGGGIPDLILRRIETGAVEFIQAKNLPLGILDSDQLDFKMEIIPVESGDRFYIYTDGVTETENAKGDMFGHDALDDVISEAEDSDNIHQKIMLALDHFRAGYQQSDDITLLEYTFIPEKHFNRYDETEIVGEVEKVNSEWMMEVRLDPSAVRSFDPRPILTELIVNVQGLYDYRSKIYTIMSELFTNALDYGLLALGSRAKGKEDAILAYTVERQRKLEELSEGYILIQLKNIQTNDNSGSLSISVEDSGPGFDYKNRKKADQDDAVTGFSLLERLSDNIEFNEAGNKVTVSCCWSVK